MGVLQSSLSPSSYPSSWKELAEWCEEATNLSTLLGDGVSGKLTDEGSGVDHGEDDDNDCDSVVVIKKRSAFFAYRRFILMVHRDIVVGELDGPDSYTTSTKCPKCAEVPANGKSNVRVKVYGKREVSKGKRRSLQRCRHGNIVDSSRLTLSEYFELNKLIFESIYKDKVFVLMERPSTGKDWESDYGIPASTISLSMPFIDPPPCEFITVAEFISALHLLRGLQHTLVTGSQLSSSPFTDTPKRVIEARLDNDLSKRMSSNKELTEKRSSAVENDRECIVCMDDTTQVVLPCTHGFCAKCSETWFNHHRDCPVCRGEVSARNCTQEEWQLESWSTKDLAEQVKHIESRLQALTLRLAACSPIKKKYRIGFSKFYEIQVEERSADKESLCDGSSRSLSD